MPSHRPGMPSFPSCIVYQVSIADVGYIHHGQFCRLFNASLPPHHPDNCFGDPEGYQPLDSIGALQERRHPPGPMVSRSISKRGADMDISGYVSSYMSYDIHQPGTVGPSLRPEG